MLVNPKQQVTEIEKDKRTVVEFRNGVLLSIAISYAMQREKIKIALGAIKTMEEYTDCSKWFVAGMNTVSRLYSKDNVRVIAPFLEMVKCKVPPYGKVLWSSDRKTWSCYEGVEVYCRICPACID